jgi:glycosyltransferase involved in cell wall biosynthesis
MRQCTVPRQRTPTRSIILCTRDRCDQLALAVDSLLAQQGDCELVIVDNGSTDSTQQFLSGLSESTRIPVQVVTEMRKGLSRARNAGVRAARSDVLLFTDDDTRQPPHWADTLALPIEKGTADAVVGEIDIAAHLVRDWFDDGDRGFFVSTISVGDLRQPNLIGASMAVRRSALADMGGFDERLGVGAPFPGGEDLRLTSLLRQNGYTIVFAPGAPVEHHFDPSRLQKKDRLYRLSNDAAFQAWLRVNTGNIATPLAGPKAVVLWPVAKVLRAAAATTEGRPHPLVQRLVFAYEFNRWTLRARRAS